MTDILLIRHGQASLGGDNYDQLSPLGEMQALWLAEHLGTRALAGPVALWSGAMARQHQTAAPILERLALGRPAEDAGFNEYDFEAVVMAYLTITPGYPLPAKPSAEDLYTLLRLAVEAWAANQLPLGEGQESWADFHGRVRKAWQNLASSATGTTLVVTSGGVIASVVRHLQGLDNAATIDLNLRIRNGSLTRIRRSATGTFEVAEFNGLAYLEQEDRAHAITFA
ncbi:histidine phosphatase family protein [Simiduia sp. 21SJ11W-1]|uniref:histidine phosphatase family protein n=1 Tax=Simiduia sp. 21SJ11W-1 TaxID=2909669 RepID=UPI00209F886C|nr:histidine phosphatase family protein [Simiduia sp. 21SJ11W-1]UTA46692.1 histidine phosphatase family protein [Simiduia sp. 21SJ11W-1]